MTSPQFLGIQLVCQIVPEQQDGQDEILPDSGRKTITTVILEGRMSFWIGRGYRKSLGHYITEGCHGLTFPSFSRLSEVMAFAK